MGITIRATGILFVAVYTLVAAVAALVLWRFVDVAPGLAAFLGSMVLFSTLQVHALIARQSETRELESQVARLRGVSSSLARELSEARTELSNLSRAMEEEAIRRNHAIVSEVQVLEELMEKMEADITARIDETARIASVTAKPDVREDDDRHLMLTLVREALEAGRVDLHLQPIVSLPQRKTYFYESFTRLRDHQNKVIMPADFLKVAEPAGLVSVVDNLLLFRCVQIVRRLTQKDRRVGVVCNISPHSLSDEEFFPQFLDFMRQNSDLAGSLVFEIGQRDFVNRSVTEARNMARLADFGFRFSIDKVESMEFDVNDMQRAGVKFLKIGSEMLLTAVHAAKGGGLPSAPDISVDDIVPYLARHGIELIGEKVEDEASVVELLELDTGYAQGHLFGAPKPIREEFLAETDMPLSLPGKAA